MHRPWLNDPLAHHLEARRRLRVLRARRIRRRAHRAAPWMFAGWLVLNLPVLLLFVIVVVQRTAAFGTLFRYAAAVVLWALISGTGLVLLAWIVLVGAEIGGRRAADRRKDALRAAR